MNQWDWRQIFIGLAIGTFSESTLADGQNFDDTFKKSTQAENQYYDALKKIPNVTLQQAEALHKQIVIPAREEFAKEIQSRNATNAKALAATQDKNLSSFADELKKNIDQAPEAKDKDKLKKVVDEIKTGNFNSVKEIKDQAIAKIDSIKKTKDHSNDPELKDIKELEDLPRVDKASKTSSDATGGTSSSSSAQSPASKFAPPPPPPLARVEEVLDGASIPKEIHFESRQPATQPSPSPHPSLKPSSHPAPKP